MTDSLATPEQIMEELADRVIVQIERRAPTGFENTLDELTAYHTFLLELYATKSDKGEPLSYAGLSDDLWGQKPHDRWIRQYRRLFDRAAERIPDGHRFIETLSYVPGRLLGSMWGDRLSPSVVASILDLQPILMHAVEAWVTRRSVFEADEQGPAKRTKLAGSDTTSLAAAMHGLVGAWESHLSIVSSAYGWSNKQELDANELWSRFVAAWPYLRQHVAHTSYSLAVAVWNGDAISASLFREALVRWPGSALIDLHRDGLARHPWLLMPQLLTLPWAEARARPETSPSNFVAPPSPDSIFAELVDGLHKDVVLVTASLMLAWSQEDGPVGDLAAEMARELVSGEGSDPTEHQPHGFGFDELARGFLRLQLVGERYEDLSHGGWLDHLVRTMDTMREKSVVPGRVYSPTTMDGREQLMLSEMAMIATLAPDEPSRSVLGDLDAISDNPELLPSNDRSLRAILHELARYERSAKEDIDAFSEAIRTFSPTADTRTSIANFQTFVSSTQEAIQSHRTQRLRDAQIDREALETLRKEAETALLESPADVPVFDDVEVFTPDVQEGEIRSIRLNGIDKGTLVRPEMEQRSNNFPEVAVRSVREGAGNFLLRTFAEAPKKECWIYARLDDPKFWIELTDLSRQVGERPVLVVSHADSIDQLSWRQTRGNGPLARLNIDFERSARERGNHVATIEGIEIFSLDIERGTAWLTSARHLRRVGYAPTEAGRVSLAYVPDDGDQSLKGSLVYHFRQVSEWGDEPAFEIRFE